MECKNEQHDLIKDVTNLEHKERGVGVWLLLHIPFFISRSNFKFSNLYFFSLSNITGMTKVFSFANPDLPQAVKSVMCELI